MKNRKTKIVATIGPATLEPTVFLNLVREGVDIVRINCAYGGEKQYDQIIRNVIEAGEARKVEVLLDIKDIKHVEYALEREIKMIAVSFTNHPQQIEEVRRVYPEGFIIAKIETEEGIKNFDEIMSVADGIMVARGDLGVAVPLERIPLYQKVFTAKALQANKLLITATEMLLSMVNATRPTRAEVSDVANAVFDGACAVMLSEETAIGKYPVEAVRFMRRIIEEAEAWKGGGAL